MLSFFKRIKIAPNQTLVSKIQYVFIIAIILIILYQLIVVCYTVMTQVESPTLVTYEGYSGGDEKENNSIKMIAKIKKMMLFSQKRFDDNSKDIVNVIDNNANYPIYTGEVRLVGILEHKDETKSIAILQSNGRQKSYFIHDEISDGTTIVKILTDKIILNKKGSYFLLRML
ncbi:general secretion pathway protein GspC [Yersinia sp. KBS0713]|uniref:type II secretion system protein N n=1 Tax=Yersinia sp. KBS0713 TaxID=1179669 RepID=UPI00110F63D8|nr:type II secretion system protein N [Yersinia sp. KBS0713]QDW32384.1 general secretion pathway protein GspC [Yersinia sp. KBS0713]